MEPSSNPELGALATYDVPYEQRIDWEEHAVMSSRVAWRIVQHQRQREVYYTLAEKLRGWQLQHAVSEVQASRVY